MLDMGFKPAVDRIVAQTPDDRQTLFFSATLEGAAGKIAAAYTRDARRHDAGADERREADDRAPLRPRRLPGAKVDLLVERAARPAIAAARWSSSAPSAAPTGWSSGCGSSDVHAVAMHGDKSQAPAREGAGALRGGDVDALVATDVAARGIDVADVTHVINFDAPEDGDAYMHRVGRTGRAGAAVSAISFVLADQANEMRQMAARLGLSQEFDRREGKQHGSVPAPGMGGRPSHGGSRNGNSRSNGNNRSNGNGNGAARTPATSPRPSRSATSRAAAARPGPSAGAAPAPAPIGGAGPAAAVSRSHLREAAEKGAVMAPFKRPNGGLDEGSDMARQARRAGRQVADPKIEEPTDAIIRVTSTGDLRLRPPPLRGPRPVHDRGRHPRPRADGHRRGGGLGGRPTSRRATGSSIPFNISCGHCWMCDQELYAQCETTQIPRSGQGAALLRLHEALRPGAGRPGRVPARPAGAVRADQGAGGTAGRPLPLPLRRAADGLAGGRVRRRRPKAAALAVFGLGPIGQMAARIAQHAASAR